MQVDANSLISDCIKEIHQEVESEDAIAREQGVFTDDLAEQMPELVPGGNLGLVPIERWSSLKVSRLSSFGDAKWDWRGEGSPMYKDTCFMNWDREVDDDIPLLIAEHAPLVTLLRALLYYCLPQNAVFMNVTSFNTSHIHGKALVVLGRFLRSVGAYIGDWGPTLKTGSDLRPEVFRDHLATLPTIMEQYRFFLHVQHWRKLSCERLLPPIFQLPFDVFDAEQRATLVREFDEAKNPYQPISLEALSTLITESVDLIEKYADHILNVYEQTLPLFSQTAEERRRTGFDPHSMLLALEQVKSPVFDMQEFIDPQQGMSTAIAFELRRAIQEHAHWRSHAHHRSATALNLTPIDTVKSIATDLGIDLYNFNRAIYYDLGQIYAHTKTMVSALRNACAVIVFLVTGMRRSELLNIEVGKYWRDLNKACWLKFRVWKTSEGSMGDETAIPIPEIAYRVLQCLERLTCKARELGKSNSLFVSPTGAFGKLLSLNAINQFLARWCEDLGLEEHIHPHQFRKTLAMFMIYQDPKNLSLIRRLFNHKSLTMTLAYIVKLPGLRKEILVALYEQDKDLVSRIIKAVESNAIGGRAGVRIKENMRKCKYQALLMDGKWIDLGEYVEALLQDHNTLLHRGLYNTICTKTPAVDQRAPCDPPYGDKVSRLHPNLGNCNPLDCYWAVFTQDSIEDLQHDITFHKHYMEHVYTDSRQKEFSLKTIELCQKRIAEITNAAKPISGPGNDAGSP